MIRWNYDLESYSLNDVSCHFLGDTKEDVHSKIISELQEKDEFTRQRLAVYCLKDAYLPLKLMEEMKCLDRLIEEARKRSNHFTFHT